MAYKYICKKCGVGSMRETNDVSIMCDGVCGYLISPSQAIKVEPMFEAPAVDLEDDLTFKLSEAHVITMGKLERLRKVGLEVVDRYIADVTVHPCDEQNRDVKISVLPPDLRRLAEELKSVEAPEFYAHNHPLHRAVFVALDSYMSGDTFEDGVLALTEQSKLQAEQIKSLDACLETVNKQRDHWMAIAKGEQ